MSELVRGLLQVNPVPGGKRFQGVKCGSVVLSYRPVPELEHLYDHEVECRGETYEPRGQAVSGVHFRYSSVSRAGSDAEEPRTSALFVDFPAGFDTRPHSVPLPPLCATLEAAQLRRGRYVSLAVGAWALEGAEDANRVQLRLYLRDECRLWSPASHERYPSSFRHAVRAMLLLGRRRGLPRDIVFLVLAEASRELQVPHLSCALRVAQMKRLKLRRRPLKESPDAIAVGLLDPSGAFELGQLWDEWDRPETSSVPPSGASKTRQEMLLTLAIFAAAAHASATCSARSASAPWVFYGPTSYKAQDGTLNAGAIQDVLLLGGGAGPAALVGSTNGGVWKTDNIGDDAPHWRPVTDNQPIACTSIAAMGASSYDDKTVFAGCGGSTSSEQGYNWNVLNTGDWGGVMVSHDAGESWQMTTFPPNYFVTSIVQVTPTRLLVAARSHYFEADAGGIFLQDNGGPWKRVSNSPVFNVERLSESVLLAALPNTDRSVVISRDGGDSWEDFSSGIEWKKGSLPFYPFFSSSSDADPLIFFGALTAYPNNSPLGSSQIFSRRLSASQWTEDVKAPFLEGDNMPKDRGALLLHGNLLVAVGNVNEQHARVLPDGDWFDLGNTTTTYQPHADHRNLAWNPATNELIMVCDGGIFARKGPFSLGAGAWRSLNGDIGILESVDAAWDASGNRVVTGAQDNGSLLSPSNAPPGGSTFVSFDGGDGQLVAFDNTRSPARAFASSQYLGQGQPSVTSNGVDVSNLRFRGTMDYFVQPMTLNRANTSLYVMFQAARPGLNVAGGIYTAYVPDRVEDARVARMADAVGVMTLVAGGVTEGRADQLVLVGVNATHLYHGSASEPWTARRLPVRFATPVTYPPSVSVGPLTHGKTVSLAVHPQDSNVVAVTGWPSVTQNAGNETIWLSRNAGRTWQNIMGNLRSATGTVGQVRPQGLNFVGDALVVGTTRGLYGTFDMQTWQRLGTCAQFPLVLTMNTQYEPISDNLVAATFGRGVYVLHNASKLLTR